MRCFVFFVGVPRSVNDTVAFTYKEIMEEAQAAEELGYYAIWVAEHHAAPHYGVSPNPIILCSAIAARTSRIRVGTGCTVLPLFNPIRVAEDIAMLDAISNGRAEMALCRGSHVYEYDSLGVSFDESKKDYDIGLREVKRILVEASEGRSHGRTPAGAEILPIPRPVQQPLPPLWTTCTSVASMGLALDNELSVAMPSFGTKAKIQEMRKAFDGECRKRGLDPAKQRYGLSVYAWASEKTEEIQQTEDAWAHINNMATQLRDGHNSNPREDSGFKPPSLEEFRDANLVGSDARLKEQIAFYEAAGVTDLICAFPRSFPSATIRANMARVAAAIGLPLLVSSREPLMGKGSALEQAKRLADELEIRNQLARLAHTADNGTLEEYLDCWTEDGSWEVPDGTYKGHAAIGARAAESRAKNTAGPGSHFRHVLMNQEVTVDGSDTAFSEQYCVFFRSTETPTLRFMNVHRDTMRRTPAGWRLARRQSTPA